MLVEAPVFGRQHRLDEVIGEILERHGIVVLDAAVADFVAVAVEKGDGEFGFLQPVVVGGVAERRNRERQHQHQPAGPQRRRLRERLDQQPAPPAGDVEAVHEGGVALVEFARPFPALEHRGIDAGVDIQHQPLELRLPVAGIGEHVLQRKVLPESGSARVDSAVLADKGPPA